MSKHTVSDVNPMQKEAVLYCEGPLLVLAGAGSGKTRVITQKFAHLAKKFSPESILALTFTNKAASEMKERIDSLHKPEGKALWIGTFHSQCTRILRREISHLGFSNDFTIYNDTNQQSLIRHILKEFKLYEALYKGVLSKISALKASLVTPEDFLSNCEFGFDERLARVYVRYQDELKRSNALDFDDLLLMTIKVFKEYPKVLSKYQKTFKYILVDEFQDTNYAQYELLKMLAGPKGNICAVGDDDQSIYRFRGANVTNILNFENDFTSANVIRLEQNYRSTQNILDVSGGLISKNPKRHEKKLWTDRGSGEKVYHCWLGSEKDESRHIAKTIRELYLKGSFDFKDMAILYRVNSQSKVLEETLYSERIPYRVVGSISFFQRKEVKDLMGYLLLINNNDDNVSLRRVINTPPRGIGSSTLSKIETLAKKKSLSLFAAIKAIIKTDGITASIKEKLGEFVSLIETLSSSDYKVAKTLLNEVIEKTSYMDFVDDDRIEVVREFMASSEDKDVTEFLDELALISSSDVTNTDNAVSLMTLHSAKGLEFPVVFISGIEEGVLPYFKAKDEAEIAEERRLFYVGMTRAKELLWLTGAGQRRMYAKIQEQEPSRFMSDIPKVCCQKIEKSIKPHAVASAKNFKTSIPKIRSKYVVGTRVKHPKWGVGVVRDFQGEGDDQKVTVNFPEVGIKRLALKFAHLERM